MADEETDRGFGDPGGEYGSAGVPRLGWASLHDGPLAIRTIPPMPMPAAARHHRFAVTGVAVALTLAALMAIGPAASAAVAPSTPTKPISMQQQAIDLTNQIENSDLVISALAEKLDAAEAARSTAEQVVADAQARITTAKAQVTGILGVFHQNAVALYRRASQGSPGTSIDFGNASDLAMRDRYSAAVATRDKQLLDSLKAAQDDLAVTRNAAQKAQDEATSRSAQISAAKVAMEAARGAQQALLNKVKGELAAAVAAERARREQAARAKYATPHGPVNYPNVGPPNGSAAQAIAFARGVIGAPYSTNPRMGPSYDCSGLVTMAWRAAGVSIPTTSGSEYRALPHIPLSALQPGDLIFYGPGGSSHVALYVGGGLIIDASGTHGVVQRAIWGSPIGAARVT